MMSNDVSVLRWAKMGSGSCKKPAVSRTSTNASRTRSSGRAGSYSTSYSPGRSRFSPTEIGFSDSSSSESGCLSGSRLTHSGHSFGSSKRYSVRGYRSYNSGHGRFFVSSFASHTRGVVALFNFVLPLAGSRVKPVYTPTNDASIVFSNTPSSSS